MADQSRPPANGYPAPQSGGATAAPSGHPPGATGYPYAGGTGYPYVGPPAPQSAHYYDNHNPNPYYDHYNYDARRAAFFRRLLAAIIAAFIIFGVIVFIMWLVIRPRVPEFHLESFSVSQFNVSYSSSEISGVWEVKFTVVNPNSKMHVYYDKLEGDVFYKKAFLAQNQLPPFDQGTKTQSNITAKLVASSVYVDKSTVSGINEEKAKGGVKFLVVVEAVVHFKSGVWSARRRWLRVYCTDLIIGIASNGSNGTMTGGPKTCVVGV